MGDYDMCEYIFSHENAMRRLINLLRNSQTYCTDNECFEELPGGGLPNRELGGSGMDSVFLLSIGLFLLVLLMNFVGPQIRRNRDSDSTYDKSNNNQGPNGGNDPPPAVY